MRPLNFWLNDVLSQERRFFDAHEGSDGICLLPTAVPRTDSVHCITLAYVGKVRDRIFTISEDFANGHISNNFYKVCSFKHLRNVKLDIYGNFDIVFALFGHRFYTQKSENHRDPTVICRTFSVISP